MFPLGHSRHFQSALSARPLDPNDLTFSALIGSAGRTGP